MLWHHLGPSRVFIVLSVLRSTDSHYPFGVFKHFSRIERKLQMEEKEQRTDRIRNNGSIDRLID